MQVQRWRVVYQFRGDVVEWRHDVVLPVDAPPETVGDWLHIGKNVSINRRCTCRCKVQAVGQPYSVRLT